MTKKQKKQLIILLILLVLVAACYAWIHIYNGKQEERAEEKSKSEEIAATQLDISAITGFSYYLDGKKLIFAKEGEAWLYDGDRTMDLNEDAVAAMLGTVQDLHALEAMEEYGSLEEYGLLDPSNTITLTTKEGDTTLYIGNQNPINSSYYLMTGSNKTVYLVDEKIAAAFGKTIEELTAVEETEAAEEETK